MGSSTAVNRPRTFVEAVVEKHSCGDPLTRPPRPGDIVWLRPSKLMSHDNTSAILARFRKMGATRVADPSRCVIVLDHDIQNKGPSNLAKYAAIETFAREQSIEFHPAGTGIGHQVMIERGHVRPGELCVAADSHANMYGALGALGIAVSRSDAAGIWASGMFWWEVPPSVRVDFEGRLPEGTTGKDVALLLCALYPDDVLGSVVEFDGPGAATLAQDDRLTLSNLTTEWGAIAGVFPAERALHAEANAAYAATIAFDLSAVSPHVAGPDTLTRAVPVTALAAEKMAIQKAYLVSCANGRLSDLDAAAAVLRGRRVAPGVSLYVAAASARVQRDAEASGAWGALLDAGAYPLPAGCGPCIGLGAGLLEPGETGISASNRNFKGRMGSAEALCYLASPAVVAASAVAGFITGPGSLETAAPKRRLVRHAPVAPVLESAAPATAETITGRLIVFLKDGIDSDALCPARLVYADNASRDDLARAVFGSIDPAFASQVRPGDVLVCGARFGTGSSREQAVTALFAAGIRAVVAESLAPVFRRNAWNNGFPAIERPELVKALRSRFTATPRAATFTSEAITVDLGWLPDVARGLIAAGGLDSFLRMRVAKDGD
jgi:homoaconitate hydratase